MPSDEVGFLTRLWLAFIVPWKILFNALFAARVHGLMGAPGAAELPAGSAPEATPAPTARPAAPPKPAERDTSAALQLLAIMQREGRLIDFLQEDVATFSDAEIGAAARVVHEGCRRGLKDYLDLAPVRTESEGASVVLERGFDPARTRVTGSPSGEPPFKGRLAHHGWLVKEIRLPALNAGHDPKIVAPAEVEVAEASR
jgi:hypothetical protein